MQITVDKLNLLCYNLICSARVKHMISGCGAVGSALPWGGRGRWFKSSHSDLLEKSSSALKLNCSFFVFICILLFVNALTVGGNASN